MESPQNTMKCVNVRLEDDLVWFDCPHCGVDAKVDEEILAGVWDQSSDGRVPCPPPEGCGKEYVLPSLAEVAVLNVTSATTDENTGEAQKADEPAKEEETTAGAAPATREEPIIKAEAKTADPEEPTPIIRQTVSARPERKSNVRPAAARDTEAPMAIRTFRHSDWQGGGSDSFDDVVSEFQEETGTANVVVVTGPSPRFASTVTVNSARCPMGAVELIVTFISNVASIPTSTEYALENEELFIVI